MIINVLKQANDTIRDSVQISENKHAADVFKKQVMSLNQLTDNLDYLLNIIKAMQSEKMGHGAFTSSIKDSLQSAVEACGQKTDDRSLDADTVSAFKSSIQLCRNSAENAWKAAAEQLAGYVEKSLSSLSSILPDNEKERASYLQHDLATAKKNLPGSSESIAVFKANVKEGETIVNALNLDSEADSFIQKVRNQTATVSDLTPHILDWLRENNLNRQLKIRF